MMYSNQQIVNELKAAKAELENNGWCQGMMSTRKGEHCMLGAMSAVHATQHSFHALSDHLPEGPWRKFIPAYNDAPNTTLEDVLAVFDKTIADLGGMHE